MRSILSLRTLSSLALALAAGALSAQSITVVNMVPRSLSNETTCDGEPSLAVNPANILQMAGSAFTPNPAGGTMAPYYVSTDGGNTWTLNAVMPGGTATSDVSLRFGSSSNILYAGILRSDNTNLNILRTSGFSLTTPMSILVDRASDDQPFLDARTVGGSDRVYIANNNFNGTGSQTANVDLSTNAATAAAPAGFAPAGVEKRTTASQDGPSVRSASAPDGRVYTAFLGWRSGTATFVSDVVVVRDDAGGTGSTKFQSLLGSDGLAGTKVATGQNMTFNSTLGTNRAGSSLSIAVDPTDSLTVYVAWGEDGAGSWTLHLRRSTDGGATWGGDLRTIAGATNPAIAINSAGMVGFFYQQLSGGVWINQADFAPKNDPFTSPTNIVLAQLPDGSTGTCGQPTIGDYSGMMAVGADFFGVFSGDNTPNAANFPHGVTYQRQVNWTNQQLLGTNGTTVVSTSLDPFFFHISGLGSAATAPAIITQPASTTVNAGSTASFSVIASGTAPLSYQWSKNGTAISGATSTPYTTPATTTSDNGANFTVTITNSVGSATSNPATLTVNPAATAPAITTQPANTTVAVGATATFSVSASGTAPLTYQWRKNGTAITGATASSYTSPATTSGDSGSTFSVVVTNSAGSATSNNATLTVTSIATAPAITTQPANATVNAGATATFSVTASGSAPLSYQWRKNGTAISGATSSSYTTPATVAGDSGSTFSALVTNSAGSATSNNATLTVNVVSGTTFLEVEPNNTIATANGVASSYTAIQGNLTVATDVDFFALTLLPGQTIAIAMTGPTGPDWDLKLVNSAGTQLAISQGPTTTENLSYKNTGTTSMTVYPNVYVYSGTSATPYNLALTYTGGGPVDTIPPTISASESGTSGTITFSATATDNVGVTKVEFYVDGALKGSTTTSPYSLAFDSTTITNGSHALVGKAYDAAGNVGTSSSVSFSVNNIIINQELILNGGFESGATSWAGTIGDIGTFTGEPARTGTKDCWLQGNGSTSSETIEQTVAIPVAATSATLSFWIHIDTAETSTTTAFDTLQVQVRNSIGTVLGTLATYSNLNAASGQPPRMYLPAPVKRLK